MSYQQHVVAEEVEEVVAEAAEAVAQRQLSKRER